MAVRHLDFSKLLFLSRDLCLNVILLPLSKFCINRTIWGCGVAEIHVQDGFRSYPIPICDLAHVTVIVSKICISIPTFISPVRDSGLKE